MGTWPSVYLLNTAGNKGGQFFITGLYSHWTLTHSLTLLETQGKQEGKATDSHQHTASTSISPAGQFANLLLVTFTECQADLIHPAALMGSFSM